jgi:hypothetical protein
VDARGVLQDKLGMDDLKIFHNIRWANSTEQSALCAPSQWECLGNLSERDAGFA